MTVRLHARLLTLCALVVLAGLLVDHPVAWWATAAGVATFPLLLIRIARPHEPALLRAAGALAVILGGSIGALLLLRDAPGWAASLAVFTFGLILAPLVLIGWAAAVSVPDGEDA